MPGFIPWTTVDRRLRAQRSLWLATTQPDGRPHAAPVWFVWEDDSLWFVTGRGSRKGRNLARQPWVVAHLGDGDDTFILEGRAEVVTDEPEIERVDAAYGDKYVDPHSGTRATVRLGPSDDLYRVRPERVMVWEYGVVATRTDWRFVDGAPILCRPGEV